MLYDENNNPIEGALTPEEAKALQEQKEKELTEAREAAKKLEEDLSKLKEKDLNFSNLRAQKEEADKRAEELKNAMEVRVQEAKKEVLKSVLDEHYNDMLNELSGGDEELKKKIESQYMRLSDPISNKRDIERKLNDALSLSGVSRGTVSSGAFSSASSSVYKPAAPKYSDDDREVLEKLAKAGGFKLEDKDFK